MLTMLGITTKRGIQWYGNHAKGGVSMVIVESTPISRFSDEFQEGSPAHLSPARLAPLAAAIHAGGALAAIQLFPETRGLPAKATPSGVTGAAVAGLGAAYARAARACADAGFDAVEVHGANPFLLFQFATRQANLRLDEYKHLPRLACDVVRAIRAACPPSTLLMYRHTIHDPERYAGAAAFASELREAGLDLLDLSPGGTAAEPGSIAAALKRAIAEAGLVGPPVISVGGMDVEDKAREALAQGRTELVAIGRGLIADPNWPEKVRQGRQNEVVRCIRCGMGCTKNVTHHEPVACLRWDSTQQEPF